MWPHMNSPSNRPEALCATSMRAGQALLRGRSARPTPAITSLLLLLILSSFRPPHLIGRSEQITLPVDDDPELIARGLGVLLIQHRRPRAEPDPPQRCRLDPRRAIVDVEVVLGLI